MTKILLIYGIGLIGGMALSEARLSPLWSGFLAALAITIVYVSMKVFGYVG